MNSTVIKRAQKSINRRINQLHAYDYPEENGGWHKYEQNPILGNTQTGSLFDPCVRRVNQEYVMCLSRRVDHSIMLFFSKDGFKWENGIEILTGIEDSNWEKRVNRACFLFKDNVWHLWYTGQNKEKSKIGYAVSEDGIHYIRVSSSPVLSPEYFFEGENVMNPCVIWDDQKSRFHMWYAAGENYEPDVICYAYSNDGIHWNKNKAPVIQSDPNRKYKQCKVGACDVMKADGTYYMAYIAYQNLNVARIAFAKSHNGIDDWKECYNYPILSPGKGKWDRHAVYKPTLCTDESCTKIFLWYNGRYNHKECIGMAIKDIN